MHINEHYPKNKIIGNKQKEGGDIERSRTNIVNFQTYSVFKNFSQFNFTT